MLKQDIVSLVLGNIKSLNSAAENFEALEKSGLYGQGVRTMSRFSGLESMMMMADCGPLRNAVDIGRTPLETSRSRPTEAYTFNRGRTAGEPVLFTTQTKSSSIPLLLSAFGQIVVVI